MDKWKNDIERYRSGKMTPAERHALEKQALSDPFLADALEGAESISAEEFSFDVAELNQKIVGEGKNRWLWPLRIAASVVGIALASTVVIFSMKDDESSLASNQKQTESKQEQKTTQPTDSIPKIENEKAGDENLLAGVTEEKKESKPTETKPAIALRRETQTASTGGAGVTSTGPIKVVVDTISAGGLMASFTRTDSIAATDVAELAMEEEVKEVVPTSPPTLQPIVADTKDDVQKSKRALASTPIQTNLTITGQVRDQQGQPLPGVNITVKGTASGTTTNAEGKYSMSLADANATLLYSFIGYVPQEMKADKAKEYADVQLMEDATQLSEVVVTGYGEKKTDGEPVVRLAEPIGGMKAYDKYLEDKKIYPQQALDNKVEGKVVVEFTVSTTGAVSDFNVIRKIGSGCEEEVIRLVKEGPGWYPSYIDNEPVESLVRVKTRFELPEKK